MSQLTDVTSTAATAVLVEHSDRLVTVTINRPSAHNALSRKVLLELRDLLLTLQLEPSGCVAGVILTGAGDRAFVAGADIREMAAMTPAEAEEFAALGQEVTELLERLPVPVIAAVHGYALGGGCELAMAADFVYCTGSAVFGQPEVTLGLIPGFGGCVRLQRLVGPALAKELIYTGRKLPAAEAVAAGLVNRVFATKDEMLDAARQTMAAIARNYPVAVASCKAVIGDTPGRSTAAALDVERAAFGRTFESVDMRVGTRAFLDKESAVFPGR